MNPTRPPGPKYLLSLTALLKSNRPVLGKIEKSLREKSYWSDSVKTPLFAPASYRAHDYSIVGSAFDYWLRAFFISQCDLRESETVVEKYLKLSKMNPNDKAVDIEKGEITLESAMRRTVKERRAMIRDKDITSTEFFENCIENGMFEGLYRSGRLDMISCPSDDMVADLIGLSSLATDRSLHLFAGAAIDVNPVFSNEIFAADGDFALGNRLVDIKTTKDLATALVFVQVLCYSLIEAWRRGSTTSSLKYNEIAVYSARFGAMGVVELVDVKPEVEQISIFLRKAAAEHKAS